MRKIIIGVIFGVAMVLSVEVLAVCVDNHEMVRNVNILFIDTGSIVHCPSVTYDNDGHVLICNR